MRAFLIALCACGGTATNVAPAPAATSNPVRRPRVEPREPVDVIAALARPLEESSWIAPGPAQLVLGGATVQANEGAPRLEVGLLEEQGNDVRVGVRLAHARFALWMARSRLLAIVARDQRLTVPGAFGFGSEPMQVVLRPGALVQRLAHEDTRTRVRYVGPLETDGWVPDDALTDRAPADRTPTGRVPTGRKPLMLMPGAVIRVEPKWAGAQLAVMNEGYVVDEIKPIDDAWSEVSYEDGDLFVHGYVSRREPPGRVHRRKQPEAPAPLAPNTNVADGTCLHVCDEPVGFLVGDQPALVERGTRPGWFTLTIDTPWGPLAFEARGTSETELRPCAG